MMVNNNIYIYIIGKNKNELDFKNGFIKIDLKNYKWFFVLDSRECSCKRNQGQKACYQFSVTIK